MNLFTLRHRKENFQEELNQLQAENIRFMYDDNTTEVRSSREKFLIKQIDQLIVDIAHLNTDQQKS